MSVSLSHELLVEMFRNRGELAPELLRTCARITLDHERIEVTSIDLSQVTSTEYRGVTLLVFTADPAVTRWAKKPIDLGHPGFCLEPIVIQLEDLPESIDRPLAQKLPELAVLAAMAHPSRATAETAVEAIAPLPEDQKQLYLDVILARLPAAVRQLLESSMLRGYKYQSEYALRYFNQGLHQGLRTAVLVLAKHRLADVTADDEAQITSLDEPGLTDLITALGAAHDRAHARSAFDDVIRNHRGV